MDRRPVAAALRLAFAALTTAAIVVQYADLAGRGTLNPANFLSYFTIQSNLIGIAAFVVTALAWRGRSAGVDLLRGGATLYLTVTFVVFTLLLSGTDVDTAIPWVNTVLHGVFPVVVIADWVLTRPVAEIGFRRSLAWLAYPMAWVVYTLVRGALAGWYPYPFINPDNGGYPSVAGYVVAIFAFGVALCALLSAVARWRWRASAE
jgi:hypothetical protein